MKNDTWDEAYASQPRNGRLIVRAIIRTVFFGGMLITPVIAFAVAYG